MVSGAILAQRPDTWDVALELKWTGGEVDPVKRLAMPFVSFALQRLGW